MMKGLLRLYSASVVGLVIAFFKSLKTFIVSSFQLNTSSLSNCVGGLQMVSYPFMKPFVVACEP